MKIRSEVQISAECCPESCQLQAQGLSLWLFNNRGHCMSTCCFQLFVLSTVTSSHSQPYIQLVLSQTGSLP